MQTSYDDYRQLVANVISAQQGKPYLGGKPVDDTQDVRDAYNANMTPEQCGQMLSVQANKKVNESASGVTGIVSLLILGGLVWLCGGFFGIPFGPSYSSPEQKQNLALEETKRLENEAQKALQDLEAATRAADPLTYLELVDKPKWKYTEYGSAYLTGSYKNKSNQTLSMIYIKFDFKNKKNEIVSYGNDVHSSLAPGDTWRYKVNCIEDGEVSANLSELTVSP